jgi:hypothetical protein
MAGQQSTLPPLIAKLNIPHGLLVFVDKPVAIEGKFQQKAYQSVVRVKHA